MLFAYGTVTHQCPVNPLYQRVVCSRTKKAAHWCRVHAPIRGHWSSHADMHGKREAAQVIGTLMSSLCRVRIARFDARPSCAPTFSRARRLMFGSSGPHMLLPTEKSDATNVAVHGEDAFIGLRLSGDSPAARRPCRSGAAPARRVITAIPRPLRFN